MEQHLCFDIIPDETGGYHARCRQADIFTQGETLDEVRRNALEAVQAYFFDRPADYLVTFEVAQERVRVPA